MTRRLGPKQPRSRGGRYPDIPASALAAGWRGSVMPRPRDFVTPLAHALANGYKGHAIRRTQRSSRRNTAAGPLLAEERYGVPRSLLCRRWTSNAHENPHGALVPGHERGRTTPAVCRSGTEGLGGAGGRQSPSHRAGAAGAAVQNRGAAGRTVGRHDSHAQLAMRRVEFATTSSQEPARAIAKLELDANYFWEPEDTHWRALSAALRLAPAALKQALYRSQES